MTAVSPSRRLGPPRPLWTTRPFRPRRRLRAWGRLRRRRPSRLAWLAALGCFWLAALGMLGWLDGRVAWVTVHRVAYPFELEFQEGDHALAAMRVLDGKPLYPDPKGDWLPLAYPPLTYRASAWAMALSGERSLLSGRLVALAATLGCLLAMAGWTWRETRSLGASLAAPMAFYAVAPLTGWWFDLYRVDMPFLLLTALGAWLLLDRRGGERAEAFKGIVAGALLVLAALAKQTGAVMAIGLVLLALPASPTRAIWAASSGLTSGLMALGWLLATDRYFWFYCVTVVGRQGLNLTNWQERLWREIFLPALPAACLVLAWTAAALARRRWRWGLWPLAAALAMAVSLRGALKLGGYVNHYLLGWLFLLQATGIALGSLPGLLRRRGRPPARLVAPALALALALWLAHATGAAAWRWRPAPGKMLEIRERDRLWEHLPRDEQSGRRLIQAIRDLPGTVWVMHHNDYAWLAGRAPGLSIDSARDQTIGGQPVSPAALRMLESGEFDYIVLDNLDLRADWLDEPIRQAIRRHYDFAENWENKFGFQALRPVDRTAMKPRALWKRRAR